jgi:hypothetical protein
MDIWIKGRTSVSRKRRARQLGTHTFYIGTLKGVSRIYQQTFLDTYTKFAIAKLYDRKTPLVAAELLNDRVIPFRRASDTAATGSDFLVPHQLKYTQRSWAFFHNRLIIDLFRPSRSDRIHLRWDRGLIKKPCVEQANKATQFSQGWRQRTVALFERARHPKVG